MTAHELYRESGIASRLQSRLQSPVILFSRVISWSNSAGTLWVFCLMFLICADVIARGVFNYPLRSVPELVGYSIAGAVFMQLAHTLHMGRFTRAEMMIDAVDKKRPIAGTIYHATFNILGIIAFGIIVHGSYLKLVEAWPDLKFGNEGDFSILVWPLRFIIMIGAALTLIEYSIQLVQNCSNLVRKIGERSAARTKQPIGWGYLACLAVAALLVLTVATGEFSRVQIGLFSLGGILILIYLGMHIGIGLITLSFIGTWAMMGSPLIGMNIIKIASNEFLRNYFFGVVPLFVLMGMLVNESNIGKDTFDVARWALRPIKGGLGVATVAANAIFAAITGSSIASAAVFSKVAAPQMMDHGYSPRFAVGTVAGSSVLGMLIPPSLLLIIYGFVAEQSVGLLFLAAVVPGIILAVAMAVAIIGLAHFWPSFVGVPETDDIESESIGSAAWKLLPVFVLVGFVMGGIYGGWFTPVEAGAVGAMGALIIATLKRRLTLQKLWNVLVETGHVTVAILFLILAANIYARMLALSGLPQEVAGFIAAADLGFYGFMALYVFVLIVMGMFLDSVSIMLIILPLVLTIAQGYGVDLIWFGIITVISVEMGLLTPPMGISCFVVRSSLNDDRVSLNDIFAGAFPFVVIMLLVTILLIAVPQLTLMLL